MKDTDAALAPADEMLDSWDVDPREDGRIDMVQSPFDRIYPKAVQRRSGTAVRIPSRIAYTQTRQVAVAPDVLERHRIAALRNDATGDAFRTLRTEVLMQMRRNNWRTLAVTSAKKGAGKSTVALNLALSFALELDHTALLVDADLREPSVRKLLRIQSGPGLSDYLIGSATLEDTLLCPSIGNLLLLPGGAPVRNTSELMRSPRMANLVSELRSRYDDRMVVFDMPAVLSGADTLAFSSYTDATLLIVEERRTTAEEISRACSLLEHANVIGLVLNKSRQLPGAEPGDDYERGLMGPTTDVSR